jgi:hypothetical protein
MYYVEFIDFCTPKRKEFKTKTEAMAFVKDFNDRMPNKEDFWIEAIWQGEIKKIIQADEKWDDYFFRKDEKVEFLKHD